MAGAVPCQFEVGSGPGYFVCIRIRLELFQIFWHAAIIYRKKKRPWILSRSDFLESRTRIYASFALTKGSSHCYYELHISKRVIHDLDRKLMIFFVGFVFSPTDSGSVSTTLFFIPFLSRPHIHAILYIEYWYSVDHAAKTIYFNGLHNKTKVLEL